MALGYNNLGNDYHQLGHYKKAKQYHKKALIITKKIFGEEHANVAISYNNLGNADQHQAMETWEMIICTLHSKMKQKNTTRKH